MRQILLLLCTLLVLLHTSPTLAAQPQNRAKNAATAMAVQAAKAYETGDFSRASALYMDAFRTDDTKTQYLFAAARAEHVGGQLDQALQHYEQFLKAGDVDPTLARKAEGYARDVRTAKAAAKAQDAEKAARTGDAVLAAKLYDQAWQIAPHHPEYGFRAAVAREDARTLAEAEQSFVAYLNAAPADAPDRVEAEARLEAVRKKLHPAAVLPTPLPVKPVAQAPVAPPVVPPPVTPTPAPTPVAKPVASPVVKVADPIKPQPNVQPTQPIQVSRSDPRPSRAAAWTLTISGAVLLAVSAGFGYVQWTDTAIYQNPARDANNLITSRTAAEGKTLADSIDRNRAICGVSAVLGATALGLGIWQFAKRSDSVAASGSPSLALLPNLQGADLQVKF